MKAVRKMAAALAGLALLTSGAQAAAPADPAPVIAAERAFAERAGVVGVAPSFLEYMADEAVVFRPDPMLARAVYGAAPPAKPALVFDQIIAVEKPA